METNKTTTELLQEVEYEIDRLEKANIMRSNKVLETLKSISECNKTIGKLKERRKSYLNFLNTDSDDTSK